MLANIEKNHSEYGPHMHQSWNQRDNMIVNVMLDICRLLKDQECCNQQIEELSHMINSVQQENKEIEKRLDKMAMSRQIKSNIFKSIGKHWWKVLIVTAPIVFALTEFGIYLRSLSLIIKQLK